MDKFVDAFGKWPAQNQVIVVVAALAAVVVLAVLAGLLFFVLAREAMYRFSILCRGWPEDEGRPTWAEVKGLNDLFLAYKKWDDERKRREAKPQPPEDAERTMIIPRPASIANRRN